MTSQSSIEIDLSEQFPHLERAPIVEAVIHWRASGDRVFEQSELFKEIERTLPEYPVIKSQHEMAVRWKKTSDGVEQSNKDTWDGFRVETSDGRNIAQFMRSGFVFSRVKPYENWKAFSDEARRLWQVYANFTEPSEVERLGVRFINRITSVDLSQIDETMELPPRSPGTLTVPIKGFLHRSLFNVPGYPYNVNVIQTTQPPISPESDSLGLILDIDVFTTGTVEMDEQATSDRLSEMRWLKNKMFYSLLTPQTIDRYKESPT